MRRKRITHEHCKISILMIKEARTEKEEEKDVEIKRKNKKKQS
jgi:hypothetical protein